MSCVFHIGLFKTGNQSIQMFLRDHEPLLTEWNMRFPRGWLRLNCHMEPHLVFMRPERMSSARIKGGEWRDPRWCADAIGQLASDLASHPKETTILSSEHNSLLRFDDELRPVRELVGDATVVVYLREREAWIQSLTDELVKYSDVGTSSNPDAFNYVGADSWLLDYDSRIAAWREWFSNVVVIDYDQVVERDGGVIPSFLAVLGIELDDELLAEANAYWLNRRGTLDEGRVAGVRWRGRRFGGAPAVDRRRTPQVRDSAGMAP